MYFIGVISESKKFDAIKNILKKYMNKNDITLININKKSIINMKNVKFETIVICEALEKLENEIQYLQDICKEAKYLIINSDIEQKVNILNNYKLNIITYGLNHMSTVTFSSITDEMMLISVQRNFKSVTGKTIEVGEYNFQISKENRTNMHEVLVAFIIINLQKQ